VSSRLGYVNTKIAAAIVAASDEVRDGLLDDQFVVDVFQTGSGTSTHTNANEVIATRAAESSISAGGSSAAYIPTIT
jgi:fumarate hydratase class II